MNNDKGLTLVELVIAMGIMSIVFLTMTSFIMFGTKTHKLTSDEAVVQSTVRLLAGNINNSIRNSSATFTLYKTDHKNFTEKWNYIMVSEDKKSVVKYDWDESQNKHIKSTIMDKVDGTTFKIEYVKKNSYDKDNLVGFKIIANVNGKERILESGLEGLNSLQIIDRRSSKGRSNTIAYRFDAIPTTVAESQAAVAMVLDTSGSMAWDMDGNYVSSKYEDERRIYKLKQEADRLINNLGQNPSIYVSLNPFSSHANASQEMLQVQSNIGPTGSLTRDIKNLSTGSGTNTADGMRRAYYRIKDFNEKDSTQKPTKNFMIILVDGATSRVSLHTTVKDDNGNRGFVTGDIDIDLSNGTIDRYDSKYYEKGAIYKSSGSSANRYVELIGGMIKNYKSKKFNEGIKVYVIGFSNVSRDKDRLGHLAESSSGESKYYEAGDETALREIFDMIKKDIDDSLWQIGGPE